MSEAVTLWAGVVAAIAAIALLRLSWGLLRRHRGMNIAGWALLMASIVAGCFSAGAWGVTVVSLVAMVVAAVLLGWAAWQSPKGRSAASNRRANMLPQAGEPARIGSRIVTFLMVAVAGMLASVALAVASRWAAMLAGAGEANATVIAFFVAPLGWTILAFLLLLTDSRRRQLAMLACATAPLLSALLSGNAL